MKAPQTNKPLLYTISTSPKGSSVRIDGKNIRNYYPLAAPKRINVRPLAPDSLIGSRLKLERAKTHITDLKAAIKIFFEDSAYSVVGDTDYETGDGVFKIRMQKPIPDEFSLLIGDAVHNLRTAMDHIICDLIRIATSGDSDANGRGMPTGPRAKRYKPGKVAKIAGLPAEAERLVCSLHCRKRWQQSAYALNLLDVWDKHNRILTACVAVPIVTAQAVVPGCFIGPNGEMRLVGPGPDGRPLMTNVGVPEAFAPILVKDEYAEVHRSPRGLNEKVDIAFDITFDQTPVLQQESVIKSLEEFVYLTERTIRMFQRFA